MGAVLTRMGEERGLAKRIRQSTMQHAVNVPHIEFYVMRIGYKNQHWRIFHCCRISEADCRAKLAAGLASQLPNAVCKKEKVWSASCMKERAAVGVYPEEKC
eukprot:1161608-Pelagomonas_calceolata.AAC.16